MSVIILDDEVNMGKVLHKVFTLEGIDSINTDDPDTAIQKALSQNVNVFLSDLRMPSKSGEEVLSELKNKGFKGEVIIMTAYGTVESAMNCVKMGAFDYITKPFDTKNLIKLVKEAMEASKSSGADSGQSPQPKEATETAEEETAHASDGKVQLIGHSSEMNKVKELIDRIAPTNTSILIYGESGTGKELVAQSLHDRSNRGANRFVAINCASIPASLMEGELFGHEKGAFTGAIDKRTGLIEAAHGGTLFLDEIGELPLELQAKLLRALQEKEISRVGSIDSVKVDIRVVAATNRNLEDEVREGRFRQDLYYRLNVLKVKLPALRERKSDIPELVHFFLKIYAKESGLPVLKISPQVMSYIVQQDWPGNVRELRNFIERLSVMTDGDEITVENLQEVAVFDSNVSRSLKEMPDMPTPVDDADSSSIVDFRQARDIFEKKYIEKVLESTEGNVSEAAKRAKMSRRNFYDKIEKLGVDLNKYK